MENDNFREKVLGRWAGWSVDHWGKALLIALAVTVIMVIGISMLQMEMTFYSILPNRSNQVRDLKSIMEDFPFASGIIVVVDGRSIDDPVKAEAAVKTTIDQLTAELSGREYSEYVSGVMGKTDPQFFRDHGLILSDMEDLERFGKAYSDLNLVPLLKHINDDFETEYSGNGEKLADEETQAVSQFRGLGEILSLLADAVEGRPTAEGDLDSASDRYLFGDVYLMSNDNRMGLMVVKPTFTMNDIQLLAPGVNTIDAAVKKIAGANGIDAGLTGITTVGRDEMETSEQGLAASSLIALLLILGLLILAFRMFSVPLISGIPLITGLVWTMGLSGFIIQRLNIMTAMYLVALMGLGIDYAIHLLTRYIQERDSGIGFREAVINSVSGSGAGIITGALTTAAAFFTLIIAKTELIKELGIVAGTGILCELAAMLILIPPLLAFRNSRIEKKGSTEHRLFRKVSVRSDAASGIGRLIVKFPVLIAVVMIILAAGFSLKSGDVMIQDNILEMEAKGLESVRLNKEMVDEFGMAPDGLMIISDSLKEVRELSDSLEDLSSVKSVESPGDFYISDEEYSTRGAFLIGYSNDLERIPLSDGIDTKGLLEELYRLEANLIEMGDLAYMGNLDKLVNALGVITGIDEDGVKSEESDFDRLFTVLESGKAESGPSSQLALFRKTLYGTLKPKLLRMSNAGRISLEMLPEDIRDSYISKDGNHYLITINPTQNPWEGNFRDIFTEQVESVTDKGTGMILAGDQLTLMAEKDGRNAAYLAVVVVFLILLADFRNLKLSLITMLPLLFSFTTLFGFMALTGIMFDFVNIIVVPLLIGIGIDDTVHINHAYLHEGKGRMDKVIAGTGTALLLTTLTTIFGFASFIPSIMRAMRSTGIVLSIAMAIAFIYSVFLHPSLLIIIHEKFGWNIRPWRKK